MDENSSTNKRIGNYNINEKEPLSTRGGFAIVYLGKHYLYDDWPPVAVKLLRTHRYSQREQERFKEEAHLLGKLEHDYILPIKDAGIEDGLPYLITEYAP